MTHPNTVVHPEHGQRPPSRYVPRPNTHTPLPSNVSKAGAIAIIARALSALALPSAVIAAWRLIADQTEATAWHSCADTPINYRKAKDLARDLSVSDRHWRRIEVQLEEAGVLYRATTENGFRGKAARGALTFGLSLEPALAHFEQLCALAKRPERVERERKLCLGQIRALRKRLASLASFDPLSPEHQALWDAVEDRHRPARPGFAEHGVLVSYLEELTGLEDILRARRSLSLGGSTASDVSTASTPQQNTAAQALPCPNVSAHACASEAAQIPQSAHPDKAPTSTKMSDAADSDVRCQYNLKYNTKRLNAHSVNDCFEEAPELALQKHRTSLPADALRPTDSEIPREAVGGSSTGNPVVQPLRSASCPPQARGWTSSPPIFPRAPSSQASPLPSGHRLNLTLITRIFDHPALLQDIRAAKAASPCAKLDPQHIWDRFRRYNLKRDKQILPLGALRAFIKGWIPDGQISYLEQHAAPQSMPATLSEQSPTKPKPTREETIAFYKSVLESGKYVPPNMVPKWVMHELA